MVLRFFRKWLKRGTVPQFKIHPELTVPPFKMHPGGTVPPFKMHPGGTVPPFKMYSEDNINLYEYFFSLNLYRIAKINDHLLQPFIILGL